MDISNIMAESCFLQVPIYDRLSHYLTNTNYVSKQISRMDHSMEISAYVSKDLINFSQVSKSIHTMSMILPNKAKIYSYSVESAVQNNDLLLVQWLYTNNYRKFIKNAIHYAACKGYLEIVKWLFFETPIRPNNHTLVKVACDQKPGYVDIFIFFYENGYIGNNYLYYYLYNIAEGSYECFDLFVWLYKKMIDLDIDLENEHRLMRCAAYNGKLNIVKWIFNNRISMLDDYKNTMLMDLTACQKQLDVLKWLHNHQGNRDFGCTVDAMDWAAENGHLDIVKWLHENRTEGCTTRAMDYAAKNGHMDVLKWLQKNRTEGCTPNAKLFAEDNSHYDIVEWLNTLP